MVRKAKVIPLGQINLIGCKLNFPKFEEGAGVSDCLQDCDHQLAIFGIGNTTQEWPNPTEEEKVHAAWKTYTRKPMYDEEPGVLPCWPGK